MTSDETQAPDRRTGAPVTDGTTLAAALVSATEDETQAQKKSNVTRWVVEQLRRKISEGELPPGSKLPPQRELAQELNVSRTALREALSTLKSTSHLATLPNGRIVIAGASEGKKAAALPSWEFTARYTLREVYQFRLLVESYAAGQAALLRTEEDLDRLRDINEKMREHARSRSSAEFAACDMSFHQQIMQMTGNRLLVDMQLTFAKDILESHSRPSARKDSLEIVTGEHDLIIAALMRRDSDGAAYFTRRHIHMSAERAGLIL